MPKGRYKRIIGVNCGFPHQGFQVGHGRLRLSSLLDEANAAFRGESVGYRALHTYIVSRKGKASEYNCVDCGRSAQNWSNVDHSYLRRLKDYKPRCVKCHRHHDLKFKNYEDHNKKEIKTKHKIFVNGSNYVPECC